MATASAHRKEEEDKEVKENFSKEGSSGQLHVGLLEKVMPWKSFAEEGGETWKEDRSSEGDKEIGLKKEGA